ncbi:MAG: phosphoenolpyruvate carboxykinase (ATP) [Bryobacteraceae bacterium]|nr:phosphoenolpyruvate carboxykinase (ATP) [Bryobacteraceae bacterium]
MQDASSRQSRYLLEEHGLRNLRAVHWNLGPARLVEEAIRRCEAVLAEGGPLVVRTGRFTGRSPKDKFIVREAGTENTVDWGPVNQPISEEQFEGLYQELLGYFQGKEVFVQDSFAGADPSYALRVRVVTEDAWHSLFARQLFIRADPGAADRATEFTVLCAPGFHADPERHGTRSETAIVINFQRRLVLIAGTSYAGEIKKSIFTVLNYLLPSRGVLPMHCSANTGPGGVALFFGLSGTGKTTLSAAPGRQLIGDDEHGWSDRGVFNFEGGCYAKCIRLSKEKEPQIWNAIRFGTVLENVVVDPETRALDFASDEITENTRAAYPIDFIDGAVIPGIGSHPSHILFLTADAFGVLPPISRLSTEQAMYHYLSGYTAKVAGTERGLGKEPQATFSSCFGEPFLPRHPTEYARMLGEKMRTHSVKCWLVNTGWVGGAYGVGQRVKLEYTRAMVDAVLQGKLNDVPMKPHPVFGVLVPERCPGVPSELLNPRSQWSNPDEYDRAAWDLAGRFRKNFEKFGDVAHEILEAAPLAR